MTPERPSDLPRTMEQQVELFGSQPARTGPPTPADGRTALAFRPRFRPAAPAVCLRAEGKRNRTARS